MLDDVSPEKTILTDSGARNFETRGAESEACLLLEAPVTLGDPPVEALDAIGQTAHLLVSRTVPPVEVLRTLRNLASSAHFEARHAGASECLIRNWLSEFSRLWFGSVATLNGGHNGLD